MTLAFLPYIRAGWVDCWSVPNFLLIIDYTWHPIYPQKADEQLKQSCKLPASFLFVLKSVMAVDFYLSLQ